MSVLKLRSALNAIYDRTLTVNQIQRISSAILVPEEGMTNDEIADIVLSKIRRRITNIVREKEIREAEENARNAVEDEIDLDLGKGG